MVRFDPALALDLWYKALQQEIGLHITINPDDATYIKNICYQVRADVKDPRLDCLSLYVPADARYVMLYKQGVELDE